MERRFFIKTLLFLTCISFFTAPLQAGAEEMEDELVGGTQELVKVEAEKKGIFSGVGPMLGFDMTSLNSVGGGLASQFGYRFNDTYTILLQADFYYTRDRGVNYYFFPVLPIFKLTFDTNFFAFLGGGYTYLYATRGRKFDSDNLTSSKGYNGFSVSGGGGYDIWIKKKFSISPQIGVDYTRIASNNLFMPTVRLNCNWLF